MSKPRLLIPMSIQFSVRYIVRTGLLDRLREVARPVILLGWRDDELEKELKKIGCEVDFLIPSRAGQYYARVRSWMNFIQKMRLKTPSEGIWERRRDLFRTPYTRFRRRVRRQLFHAAFSVPGSVSALHRKEEALWEADTNMREIHAQMDRLKPDAALSITPFLADEEMALRVCEQRGIPLCTSVLSFDNITTRGWWPVRFDRYLVWNRYNAAELRRAYPDVNPSKIGIVGAPQFDFYWNPTFCWGEDEWRRQLALPPKRPVILFGGGHYFCSPHEPSFLHQIDEAISRDQIPGNPIILFRGHPVDKIERWLPVLNQARNVVYDDPSPKAQIVGHANMSRWDIQKLASCLFHSHVHVSVASTMAIDGAIFDRPQIGPAYDETPGRKYDKSTRELYDHEHFLPITRSDGIEVVHSRDELIGAIRSGFENPSRLRESRKKLVREICTYDDGRATERVAREVLVFLEQMVASRDTVAKSA
jgi:CDP-Glycerol:Poly(glycerophosphate) glycerophosphotransferase